VPETGLAAFHTRQGLKEPFFDGSPGIGAAEFQIAHPSGRASYAHWFVGGPTPTARTGKRLLGRPVLGLGSSQLRSWRGPILCRRRRRRRTAEVWCHARDEAVGSHATRARGLVSVIVDIPVRPIFRGS